MGRKNQILTAARELLYKLMCWGGVLTVFLLFWLLFGNGYEPTVFYSE